MITSRIIYRKKGNLLTQSLVEEEGDHDAPVHLVRGGEAKGWSATDISNDELVDDDWIAANTKGAD